MMASKTLKVKNASVTKDTIAEIIVQNKLDFTPRVSVIIPVYNVEKYLSQCMDSVINQTLREIEIICIDDGATDSSLDILLQYAKCDPRITILKQHTPMGPGASRNNGIKHANAPYVFCCDSDDWIDTTMLEQMYAKITSDNSDICLCMANVYDDVREKVTGKLGIYHHHTISSFRPIKETMFGLFAVWLKLYRRDFFVSLELWFPEGVIFEDVLTHIKSMILAYQVSFLDKCLYYYRVNKPSSIMTDSASNEKILDVFAYFDAVEKFILQQKLENELRMDYIRFFEQQTKYHINRCTNDDIKQQLVKSSKEYAKRSVLLKQLSNIVHTVYLFGIPFLSIKRKLNTTPEPAPQVDLVAEFLSHPIKQNTILMMEFNDCHCECMTGMAKYFLDLGYNVDVIMSPSETRSNPFCDFKHNNINMFCMPLNLMQHILSTDIVEKYAHVYLNSDKSYSKKNPDTGKYVFTFDLIKKDLKFPQGKFVTMCHHADEFDVNPFDDEKFIGLTLCDFPVLAGKKYKSVNTHYFGDFSHTLNKDVIKFICVGNIESQRKNHSILIDAAEQLLKRGITNFQINIVARRGELKIPKKLQPYFNFLGRLDYHDMYNAVNDADFYLTLFDPENPLHDRYLTCGASGSYQLIYGFRKPCLIPRKFVSPVNHFDESNSIIYEHNNDLCDAMMAAIKITDAEYSAKVKSLDKLANDIYKKSLKNLADILETPTCKYGINKFVSLGENCFNRTALCRHNVKAAKAHGEKSCPFDLCVCSLKSMAEIVQNDFADYFDDLTFSSEKQLWVNTKYNITYNHDLDCPQTDKEKLVKRYTERIANFREMLQSDTPLVFVFSTPNEKINMKYVNDTAKLLIKKCKAKPTFICINLSKEPFASEYMLDKTGGGVIYGHVPNPYSNFWADWYQYECFSSPSGRQFEMDFIKFITDTIKK